MEEPLFPPELLAAIGLYSPPPLQIEDARFSGRHRSSSGDGSPEFQDYRAYLPGDDLRRVDWNVYRRSGKLFLRRYRSLPECRQWIILDDSASIRIDPRRFRCAWRTAALIGGTLLNCGDPVKLRVGGFERTFSAGNASVAMLISTLEAHRANPAPSAPVLDHPASAHCYVISDFLHPDGLDAAEKQLKRVPGFTPLRIYSADELRIGTEEEIRLVDSESGREVTIRPDRRQEERCRQNLIRLKVLLRNAAARGNAEMHELDAELKLPDLIRLVADGIFAEERR